MIVRGEVAHGVLRGGSLVERYYNRLRNILGFAPYKGTLNIHLEKRIDIKDFELKRLDHILQSGRVWVDVRLAPVNMFYEKDGKRHKIECWIIREEKTVHYPDVVEILSKDNIKEKTGIKTGDVVELELFKVRRKRYERVRTKIKSIIFRGNV